MPIKTSEEQKVVKQTRGEKITLGGKEYFVRAPKARDMIALEKIFKNDTSAFSQGLRTIDYLCEELTYDMMLDMYMDELNEVFNVFDKILPAQAKNG